MSPQENPLELSRTARVSELIGKVCDTEARFLKPITAIDAWFEAFNTQTSTQGFIGLLRAIPNLLVPKPQLLSGQNDEHNQKLIELVTIVADLANWSETSPWGIPPPPLWPVNSVAAEIRKPATSIWYDFLGGKWHAPHILLEILQIEGIARVVLDYFGKLDQKSLPKNPSDLKYVCATHRVKYLVEFFWQGHWQNNLATHQPIIFALYNTQQLPLLLDLKFRPIIPALVEAARKIDKDYAQVYPQWQSTPCVGVHSYLPTLFSYDNRSCEDVPYIRTVLENLIKICYYFVPKTTNSHL